MQVHARTTPRGPIARYENLVVTEAAGEVLLYETDKHHIHHLNATTAAVWRLCDGIHTVEDLSRLAGEALGSVVDDTTVRLALTKLDDAGLLAEPLAVEMRVSRMSRRAFMQRAGVAGAIAVPAIVSTTAAVSAQSPDDGCDAGCTPFQAQCLLAGYSCWLCLPTSFSSGYCIDPFAGNRGVAARAAAPDPDTVIRMERQSAIDQRIIENDNTGTGGASLESNAVDASSGQPVQESPAEDPAAGNSGQIGGDESGAGTEGEGGDGSAISAAGGEDTGDGGAGAEGDGDAPDASGQGQ